MTHPPISTARIDHAVAALDAWFEQMRVPGGYGGPVVHWWQQSLLYTGAGLDWRYEGLITGYLQLWERTGDARWLDKACRAGNDLVSGQLASGHYPASAFEINPATAGTPHEAACDAGLLALALALRQAGRPGWDAYATCAELNLRSFYIAQLWDAEARAFADAPRIDSFVPNKAATAAEALFLLSELTGDALWIERYALPTLHRIIAHQVQGENRLRGAIAQNSLGQRRIEKYFPLYIARCIPALLRGYRWTNEERYAASALQAIEFIARWLQEDGSLPTVIYPNQRVNRYPTWVAPLGDVLRAADELQPYGWGADLSATKKRLLGGQDASGGIQTARGFARQAGGHSASTPDVRDVLHVVGWCDKAFRYLASHVSAELPTGTSAPFEVACAFRGQPMHLVETPDALEISTSGRLCYRWRKSAREASARGAGVQGAGNSWAETASPAFWLR